MLSLVLWLAIVACIMLATRGEKPLTEEQIKALNNQSAYAPVKRV